MGKTDGQKRRLIELYRFLLENSDENHTVSMQKILKGLEQRGIAAERRSIYSDVQALCDSGIPVETQHGPGGGYQLATHPFGLETSDLKLLADAVASAKFLTERKSRGLLEKLSAMCSTYDAAQLSRQVYVKGRVRSDNSQAYYSVDTLHRAVAQQHKICFRYFHYDGHKQKCYKYEGKPYTATPYALYWDNEFYYLLAWYDRADDLRNFRVDHMEDVQLLDEAGKPAPKNFDPVQYTRRVFSMFGGEEETVTLEFKASLTGTILDRFGMSANLHHSDEPGWVRIIEPLAVSQTFYGWLCQFGGNVRIISPESVRDSFRKHLETVLQNL